MSSWLRHDSLAEKRLWSCSVWQGEGSHWCRLDDVSGRRPYLWWRLSTLHVDLNPDYTESVTSDLVWIIQLSLFKFDVDQKSGFPMIHKVAFLNVLHGDWIWNFLRLLLLSLCWSSLPNRMQGRWSEISWLKSCITLRGDSILDIHCMVLMKDFGLAQNVEFFVIDVGFWIINLMIL